MPMNRRQARTAADLVNGEDVEELARIFWEWGGERDARRLARVLAQERQRGRECHQQPQAHDARARGRVVHR